MQRLVVSVRAVPRSVNTRELDRERARRIAEDGLILHGLVGSTVHGLSNPGTDDRDEMGVCIEPPEYVIGLRSLEHYVSRTQLEGVPSGPGDLDLTVWQGSEFRASSCSGQAESTRAQPSPAARNSLRCHRARGRDRAAR